VARIDEHTDVSTASGAKPQELSLVAPASQEAPAGRLRVGWVAGRTTAERFGRALQPLAIGLMDELVEILALCPEGADIQELPSPPVETISFGRMRRWGFFADTGAVMALAGELRHRKVQLLHALDAEAWPLASQLARLAGLHCIVNSTHLDDWKILGRLGDSVGKVLAASESIRQALLAHRVAPERRIELVRPGVYQVRKPTCFFDPSLYVSVVAGGPMQDYAPFEAVIRSFAELRRGGRDAVFFLMGNGRAEKRLRALGEVLGVRTELTFVDRQPPRLLPEIFKAADLYVAPIPDRSIDMPCLLAMAAGVPVLAAGQGASDFLIDGQTALGFAPRSAPDLTAKLTALLDDHAQATALADRALAHLRAHHSPAGAVAAVTRIYRQVAALPTPSPALQTP
jgi:glycosyltransferase involved in cell wall biosynthesis